MPKLVLSLDGLVLKEIPLIKERTTIGRRSSNDIQLDSLAVSGEHALITTILNDAFLEDRNSTNGTSVNGHAIRKHALKSNDVIEIAKYRLKYIADPLTSGGEVAYGVIDPGQPGRTDGTALPGEPVADAVAEVGESANRVGVVQILSGPNAGKEVLLNRSLTTLGKTGVQQAVIARRADGFFITHVEGPRTVVAGKPLDDQARRLQEHDIIELAGVKMEFFLRA